MTTELIKRPQGAGTPRGHTHRQLLKGTADMQNHGNTASDYRKILEKTERIDKAMMAVCAIGRVLEDNHALIDGGQEGFIDGYIMSGLAAALDLASETASSEAASIATIIDKRAIDDGVFDQSAIKQSKGAIQ